jgi:hypothetical protein
VISHDGGKESGIGDTTDTNPTINSALIIPYYKILIIIQ